LEFYYDMWGRVGGGGAFRSLALGAVTWLLFFAFLPWGQEE